MNPPFKRCPDCGRTWAGREALLADPQVRLCAYQANFEKPEAGQFLFNHSCGTTFSLPAKAFEDLYSGPLYTGCMKGEADCPGKCLHSEDLSPCPAKCECAHIREILQIILNWPKSPPA